MHSSSTAKARRRGSVLGLAAVAAFALQDSAGGSRHVHPTGLIAFTLPAGWRQLTPDEAHRLGKERPSLLPEDLLAPRPAPDYPYGPVERWLEGTFDGRCLTVVRVEGEVACDEEGVARIRDHAAGVAPESGWTREVLAARPGQVGAPPHPVLECEVRTVPARGPPRRALELYVPTAGDTFILALCAEDRDFAAALPELRAIAASLEVARPARGQPKLRDRLLYPAVIGALIGVALLVLRRRHAGAGPTP